MTFKRVPVNMTFCIPKAKLVGQTSQRMTARAVLAAINNEHNVCCDIGKGAREER
jgi:hypothetical protein